MARNDGRLLLLSGCGVNNIPSYKQQANAASYLGWTLDVFDFL